MARYSDAALLTGDYAHMAAEFKAANRSAPSADDWTKAQTNCAAESAAKAVAKQIFALRQEIDEKAQRLEVVTMSHAGPMIVAAIMPSEGELLRIDGHLMADKSPVAIMQHATLLSLTITLQSNQQSDDDDGAAIGFVIFDELTRRAQANNKPKAASKAKPVNKGKPAQKGATK